jgi:carbonic anhydrase
VFHSGSDHTINGKRYDLEVQVIFEPQNERTTNKVALAFLFSKEPGKVNDFINSLDLTRLTNVVQQHQPFLPKEVPSVKVSDMWNYPAD